MAESITIDASSAVLQTAKADVNTNLESRTVTNLPLSGYRNFQNVNKPGSRRDTSAVSERSHRHAATRSVDEHQWSGTRGQRYSSVTARQTFWHDAHDAAPHALCATGGSIEEVNISTNNFDADQGMTGGAAVTVSTRSGTNSFHGSAFWFNANHATREAVSMRTARGSRRDRWATATSPAPASADRSRNENCSSSRIGRAPSSASDAPDCFPSRRRGWRHNAERGHGIRSLQRITGRHGSLGVLQQQAH